MQIGAIGSFFFLVNLWDPLILLLTKVLWTIPCLLLGFFSAHFSFKFIYTIALIKNLHYILFFCSISLRWCLMARITFCCFHELQSVLLFLGNFV
jgi:hypothetical protein